MTRIKQLFINIFDLRLLLSSLMAWGLIFWLSHFINISSLLQITGAVLVYLFGILKDIAPKIVEKKLEQREQDYGQSIKEIEFRLATLEKRIDECYQISLKSQACIEASSLDEILEEERINAKEISSLKKEFKQIKESSFWAKYVSLE